MKDPNDTDEFPAPESPSATTPPSPTPPVRVQYGGASHVGKVRSNNEDHYFVARLARSMQTLMTNVPAGLVPDHFEEASWVFMVADGMGGTAAGEVASAMAITTAINLSLRSPKWGFRIDEAEVRELQERAKRYFQAAHDEVSQQARSDEALAGMGTTLTTVYSVGLSAFSFHIGDSRAYRLRGGHFEQLTRDHTLAQAYVDEGSLRPEDAATSRLRHILTSAVGASANPVAPEIRQFDLASGDRLLLCTDGLTNMVEDARIVEVLRRYEIPQEACNALVDLALENGGRDNVTVVVAGYT